MANLTDPVSRLTGKAVKDSFEIRVICNGERRIVGHDREKELRSLIEDKAVLSIKGSFVSEGCLYRFDAGAGETEVSLYNERIKGLWIWGRRYREKEERKQAGMRQSYGCGDFRFSVLHL